MRRQTPQEEYLANLRGDFPEGSLHYMPKDEALCALVKLTGQDFGLDAKKWQTWLRKHPPKSEFIIRDVGDVPRLLAATKQSQHVCLYCAQPLRSDKAQQCFLCGMDWHDSNHAVKRGEPTALPDNRDRCAVRPYKLPVQWLSSRASSPKVLLRRYGPQGGIAELIAEMQAGDEIRKFDSPKENWQRRAGRFGYALVRDGKAVSMVVLMMN